MKRSFLPTYALTLVGLSGAFLGACENAEGPPAQVVTDGLTTGGVSATLTFQSDWGNGYCANVSITNGGTTAITGWQVGLNLNQSAESQLWNGTPTISGAQLTVAPVSWNATLAPGASTTFGFCGNATGSGSYHPTLVSVSSTGGGGASPGTGGASGVGGASGATGVGGHIAGTGGATVIAGTGGHVAGTGGAIVIPGTGGATVIAGTGGHVAGTGGAVVIPGTGGSPASGTGGSASGACVPGAPWSGGKQFTSNTQGNVGNGYSYQQWSNGVGSGSMIVAGVDAKFSATWSNVGDFLARVGLGFNATKTPAQIGPLNADFAETKTGTGGGFSFIGIYGWSENPLHEYYIVEDWFGSRPNPGTKLGTFTVDGGTYDVLTHTQTNQPTITGSNATFVQFWSVRQTARQCGHISISQHFSQWASMGMQLGNLEEARLLVEVGGGSGSINFTTATVVNK